MDRRHLGFNGGLTRRQTLTLAAGAVLAGTPLATRSARAAADLDTITPGVLNVAIYVGSMPYAGKDGDKLIGFEGDLINEAAKQLGLQVTITETSFAALLANVQSRRVDVGIGSIGWNATRCQSGRFTDPPYYSPVALAAQPGVDIDSVEDLKGKTVAISAGGWWAPGLKALDNVTSRVYDALPAMISDLQAQRVDLVLYDPLPLADMKRKRPDLQLNVKYIPAPSPDYIKNHPGAEVFLPFMAGWYLPKEEPKLEAAFNQIIRGWYKSGFLAEALQKAGGDPDAWLKPLPEFAGQRIGVDRATGWQPPSI
jgi:ABC-type amino acid transport substrate-binding protein